MSKSVFCTLMLTGLLTAQQDPPATGDHERRLRNTEMFQQQRAAPATPSQTSSSDAFLGITVWRLRPSRPIDRARLLIHESKDSNPREMTPERINLSTPLRQQDHVRISIESSRTGYLYVASREQYANGTYGPAYLIFPSERIAGGKNDVRPGMLVDIPEVINEQPYLTLKRSGPDHIAEALLVVVVPQKLPGLIVKAGALLPLSSQQVTAWEKEGSKVVDKIETANGPGASWTPAEKASASGVAPLGKRDAPPQMLYRAQRDPNAPMVTLLSLKLAQ